MCVWAAQRWLPYAQMPHHHDWHHEGHKSCNFTFAALGGLWDCAFGTRKAGRAMQHPEHATAQDRCADSKGRAVTGWVRVSDEPAHVLFPVAAVLLAAALKLHSTGLVVV